jgi:hypothetical protein
MQKTRRTKENASLLLLLLVPSVRTTILVWIGGTRKK